jgi:hypothetical protein
MWGTLENDDGDIMGQTESASGKASYPNDSTYLLVLKNSVCRAWE